MIIEKVTIDHDQNRNAHELGLIAADPLICVHTLTPYILPVIIPDSMEKSYGISYFYAQKMGEPAHADSPILFYADAAAFLACHLAVAQFTI